MIVIRVLAVALTVLLALLLGLLCYLHFADLNSYRERIGAVVSEATGRSFRIEGDLNVDLWPQVAFAANKLHLANADWGSEPDMA